ncbi:MAG: chromosome partitioning protein ParB [Flammeovirgaceae bacterium]|jgi:ParB family chromosome partitioning protein|nr:chromosome partitioning protein ParB [Flammeovirgaceae bacterium]MEC7244502.1 ParB/RepB/Spo0J family partition protein [Bacteroidota bacterium]MEC7851122.1 ParB/RepB/Spo0J family partition protein [Bacteroidota bacterium]MEC8702508.1 ParB/RepB/Spo0J family partition protein [Bacteroidota bacterium]|tara:strand:- start:4456 stop:5310 length:855 start_codon:yes stop_codon:yes gene_type:complete
MVNKRNTLGRGLGSLLNVSEKKVEESIFDEIQINKIEINKDQPRKSFNEEKIKELSLSIKQHGIIQPITVRRIDNDKFQLISGERRFRASKLIGNKTIPAFIRDTDDKNLLELALIENIQRENLNSIEIAISYKKLIDELKINQEKLGARVGKDRTTINNYLRLLKLPPTIQKGLKDNKIQMGHARSLIAIETSELQLKIYQLILVNKLSVRKTEELVRNLNKQKRSIPKEKSRTNNLEKIESKLSSYFGTKITTQGDDKSGKIIIPYKSTNDLNRILELLDII